jgi:hypothetical protein
MTLNIKLQVHGFALSDAEYRHIQQQLRGLERRLVHRSGPAVELVLAQRPGPRRVEASLRVLLGRLGPQVISHQAAGTPGHAVRLAVEDVERQLERRQATQRGEPTFAVPSRRLPKQTRPHPPGRQNQEPRGGD